jgi:pimeloyl-ACP methyl ester carboxylesterase
MGTTKAAAVVDELIEMRGLRFHYRDWPPARAAAPSLVLLHGYSGHARSWDAFAEAMTDRYRVLALDQRGHGETGWAPADRYGIDDMADDLEAFVRALGLQGFTLLGLSMGGMVAIEYAGRRPEALAACVIVDVGPAASRQARRLRTCSPAATRRSRSPEPPIPGRPRRITGIGPITA